MRMPFVVCALTFLTTVAFAQAPVFMTPVEFQSKGARIAGILATPTDVPVIAGLVLVHGSGRESRMSDLARALASKGIATLTYDKRGVGLSEGTYAGPEVGTNNVDPENLGLLAADAAEAFRQLAATPALRGKPLGFWGVSQAGWIVPIAVNFVQDCRFFVLWSGPVTTVKEELAFSRIAEDVPNFWKTHSAAEVKKSILESKNSFEFEDTDPSEALRRLNVQGLWIFGDSDISIPVDLSIERLDAVNATGQHAYEYRIIKGAGHGLPFGDAFPMTVEWIHRLASQP